MFLSFHANGKELPVTGAQKEAHDLRRITYGLLGLLFTAAVAFLIFPAAPPAVDPDESSGGDRSSANGSTARQEAAYKQQMVQNDTAATERLARMQIAGDLQGFLNDRASDTNDKSLRQLLQDHPEIRRLQWFSGYKTRTAGWLSPALQREVDRYWAKARSSVRENKSYSSPTFDYEGKSYFVTAEPAQAGTQSTGVVALVSCDVIRHVERNQRRNLRLVPFPAEGRYRIESADPDSHSDRTVRTGEDNGHVSHFAVDEIVVKFRTPMTDRQLLQLRKELDLTVVRHLGPIYVFRSKKHTAEELARYFRKWNPEYAEPHYLYLTNQLEGDADTGAVIPNDTLYSEYQWNLPQIATEAGWNLTKGSKDIVVAVVDTGVQSDHPDLRGRLVEGTNIVDPSKPPEDDVGHGTHVAGIIAAGVNNNEGVAGMTWYTKIMPVKVLDSSGSGSTYSVAQGVIWAVDHGAHIINMSLGNYAEASFLHDALKYAYDRGVVLIAASGNDNTDRPGYPAAYPEVFAVAATDPNGVKADYSNFGDYIDVAAPGTSIPSTYPGSRYAALSGTSMASPHVAALASLVKAVNPQLGTEEIMDLLRKTAKDLGPAGKDPNFGHGEIDVRSALQSAMGRGNSLQLLPQQVRQQLQRLFGGGR